jgi:fatty-acyl-CoA synthase
MRDRVRQFALSDYDGEFSDRHRLHDVVSWWAARKPRCTAIIDSDGSRDISWRMLDDISTDWARRLIGHGLGKGDFLAAMLPFSTEHILLEYACFKAGIIHVPFDLRLPPAEIVRCLRLLSARVFASDGRMDEIVRSDCASVEHFVTVPAAGGTGVLDRWDPAAESDYVRAAARVGQNDGAQAIFTTGSTGTPKAALLSHRNITCQNMCLGGAFGFNEGTRLLVNLPPSHVAGQTEALMTTLFWGGTAVVLAVFDAGRSLSAISRCRVNKLGQIPAMFNLEWYHPAFPSTDLSSLEVVLYGGQQVPQPFLQRLAKMAPRMATGLGLTEAAGFCTFTPELATVDEMMETLGFDMPVYPMSIREPMREDGYAGHELPAGSVGQICFRGPQTFLGYINDPEATARAVSQDGYLYTGDMGSTTDKGLHLSGRTRWMIKPAGYQVFPGDVENHLCTLPQVSSCGVVGVEHRTLVEAIVAFVEPKPGAEITAQELRRHCRGLASYMRPLHFVVLGSGQLPLNRAAKVDYVRLQQLALEEIRALRAQGRWDT